MPFGVEVIGASARSAASTTWSRSRAAAVGPPVLDFAHMHATSDGAFTDVEPFTAALEAADDVLEPGAPFHIHFSDIAFANRNETSTCPTARARSAPTRSGRR